MFPQRMCIACRKRNDKENLLRIVKVNDEISVDVEHKIQARGAYICKSFECVKLAQKKRAIERAFSGKVNAEIYEKILELSDKNEK